MAKRTLLWEYDDEKEEVENRSSKRANAQKKTIDEIPPSEWRIHKNKQGSVDERRSVVVFFSFFFFSHSNRFFFGSASTRAIGKHAERL